jgi:hypothetical protein
MGITAPKLFEHLKNFSYAAYRRRILSFAERAWFEKYGEKEDIK